VKAKHYLALVMTAIAAALAPIQQYAIGMPHWVHAVVLAVLAGAAALGIPGISAIVNQLTPPPAAVPATPLPPPNTPVA
jgi:hypothetical protein